eukprot:2019405-Rhodomonas_salina.1
MLSAGDSAALAETVTALPVLHPDTDHAPIHGFNEIPEILLTRRLVARVDRAHITVRLCHPSSVTARTRPPKLRNR